MASTELTISVTDEQIDLLKDDFLRKYGYDFSEYSKASFNRRIQRLYSISNLSSFHELREKLINDESFFYYALGEISVNVTEMFRDTNFYKVVREKIIPVLATYPYIRIWHAGCATGEEVYSLAILLQEAGILHKCLLYGTDINPYAIERAKKAIFPGTYMQQYSKNYHECGGTKDFSSFYTSNYGMVKFNEELSNKIIFSTHNLVSDSSFNSFQLIFCRNVLIYFEKPLQAKVLKLLDQSLDEFGFLGLGSKESLRFSAIEKKYKQIEGKEKIWKKIRNA